MMPVFSNQPFEQVLAEACRMSDRQTDVFVEMEHLDVRPVDVGRLRERIEKLELGCAGRGDDSGAASSSDRRTDQAAACPAAAWLIVLRSVYVLI